MMMHHVLNSDSDSVVGTRALMLVSIVIGILVIVPVIATRFLPINDYPFHLARMVILSQLDNPIFARFYELGTFLLPNVGMDAVVIPLAQLVGAENGTRIFVVLTLLLMLFGTMSLHWAAYRRFSVWPLLAVMFLHNGIFRFGFFNYLFGLGLALMAGAVWIVMRRGTLRTSLAFAMGVVLMLCHMEAFGIFALIAGGVEIQIAWQKWQQARSWAPVGDLFQSAIPFVATLGIFVLVSPTATVAGEGFRYSRGWGTKPVGALYSLSSGDLSLDLAAVVILGVLFVWFLLTKKLSFSWPLMTACAFLVLALFALPPTLMGSANVDTRLGPAIALVAIAAVDLRMGVPNFIHWLVLSVAAISAFFRAEVLASSWMGYDREIGSIVTALDMIEPGATLFSVTSEPPTRLVADDVLSQAAWKPPVKHVASYAVLHAPVFVPMTWADPTKQPMVVTVPYRGLKAFQGDNPFQARDQNELFSLFEEITKRQGNQNGLVNTPVYLLVMGRKAFEPIMFPAGISIAAQGERFFLLRILSP